MGSSGTPVYEVAWAGGVLGSRSAGRCFFPEILQLEPATRTALKCCRWGTGGGTRIVYVDSGPAKNDSLRGLGPPLDSWPPPGITSPWGQQSLSLRASCEGNASPEAHSGRNSFLLGRRPWDGSVHRVFEGGGVGDEQGPALWNPSPGVFPRPESAAAGPGRGTEPGLRGRGEGRAPNKPGPFHAGPSPWLSARAPLLGLHNTRTWQRLSRGGGAGREGRGGRAGAGARGRAARSGGPRGCRQKGSRGACPPTHPPAQPPLRFLPSHPPWRAASGSRRSSLPGCRFFPQSPSFAVLAKAVAAWSPS